MDTQQKQALAAAMNVLIEDADADTLFQQLQGVYLLAERGTPVRLVDRAAVLNPILDIMLTKRELYEDVVMKLVNEKRDA